VNRRVVALGVIGLAVGGCFAGFRAPARAQGRSAPAAKNVWDGVYTQAQAVRGKTSYAASCSDCHGEDLEVAGDDMTSTLAGSEFLSNWGGLTAADLFERIRTTMPIDKPQSLSKETILDILAYIFSYNKFPVGQAELPHDTKMLKLITITWKPDVK
jgi:cytochrome c553